jgi:hypothetical protein
MVRQKIMAVGSMWQRRAVHLMASRKQRGRQKGTKDPQGPAHNDLVSPATPYLLKCIEPPKIAPPIEALALTYEPVGNISYSKYSKIICLASCLRQYYLTN